MRFYDQTRWKTAHEFRQRYLIEASLAGKRW